MIPVRRTYKRFQWYESADPPLPGKAVPLQTKWSEDIPLRIAKQHQLIATEPTIKNAFAIALKVLPDSLNVPTTYCDKTCILGNERSEMT